MKLKNLQLRIDERVKAQGGAPGFEEKEPRYHLGASIIGKPCWRQSWYSFRWAVTGTFEGRMLRLFETGHRYEERFKLLLEDQGATVNVVDPATIPEIWYHDGSDSYVWKMPSDEPMWGGEPLDDVSSIPWHVERAKTMLPDLPKPRQYRFSDETGHFGGSLDAKAWNVPEVPVSFYRPILAEFKTHGTKSFKKLLESGVAIAKPEHVAQQVLYMEKFALPVSLYCAVYKDTEELHFETVDPNPKQAFELELKAQKIIAAEKPPARISNSPSNFDCQYCDFRMQCHYGQPMEKNCRTCVFAQPVANGEWRCHKWNANIPRAAQPVGCPHYRQITD